MSSYLRSRSRQYLWALILGMGLFSVSVPAVRSQDSAAPQQLQTARTYVKTPLFELPLNIDEKTRAATKEVRLYCKPNTGAAWVLLEKCPPTQTKFNFHAGKEGEYTFTITMVDNSGREVPSDPDRALFHQVVVVDLQPPQADVQFLGTSKEGYNILVEVRDPNLDPTKTQVFFQTKDQVWRIIESAQRSNRYTIPIQAAITGKVRVGAADMSGNVLQRDFDLAAQLSSNSPAPAPSSNPVSITNSSPIPVEGKVNGSVPTQINSITALETGNPPPLSSLPPMVPNTIQTVKGSTQDFSDTLPLPSVPSFEPSDTSKMPAGPPLAPSEKTLWAPRQASPQSAANNPRLAQPTQILGASTSNHRAPSRVSHHLLNHKQLLLDYKIDQVGQSGVGKVEVWITSDQSKTWQRLGEDTECKSPLAIELPGEGLYGVTLVVSNGRGYGATPPRPGDAPEAWVEIDTTKPVVDFTNVRAGTGDDAGSIYVSWLAQDRNLAADTVELYFATSRDSDWQPIAKGLKNEGRYRFVPPAGVGSQIFFRLVARDLAGNTAVAETQQSVALDDQSRPRGRLLGISPLAPEVRLEPMGN